MSPFRDHTAKLLPYNQRSSHAARQHSQYGSQVSHGTCPLNRESKAL